MSVPAPAVPLALLPTNQSSATVTILRCDIRPSFSSKAAIGCRTLPLSGVSPALLAAFTLAPASTSKVAA